MAAIDRLKSVVGSMSGARHPHVEGLYNFPAIDTARLKKDLSLQLRGAEAGKNEYPSSDSTGFDDAESEILRTIGDLRQKAYEEASSHIKTYSDRLAGLHLDTTAADTSNAASNVVADMKPQITIGKNDLYSAQEKVVDARDSLEKFRAINRLDRPANMPSSMILQMGIFLAVFLLESIANGFFFADANPLGLLGGISVALFISAANIGLGVLGGYFGIRHMCHVSVGHKLAGLILLLVAISAVTALNFGAAHYRSVLDAGVLDGAERAALKTLTTAPVNGIADIKSWLLLLIGYLVAILALLKGAKSLDDIYPGYGRAQKHLDQAVQNFGDLTEDILTSITEIKDDAFDSIREAQKQLQTARREREAIITARNRLINAYNSYLSQLKNSQREFMAVYRDANRATRQTPPPERFSSETSFEGAEIVVPEVMDSAQIEKVVSETITVLEKCEDQILTAFEAAISEFGAIEQIRTKEEVRDAREAERQTVAA